MLSRWIQRNAERAFAHGTRKLRERIDKLQDRCKKIEARLASSKGGARVTGAMVELLLREQEGTKVLMGDIAARSVRQLPATAKLAEAEFQVFSQWGEDGILQFLLAHVPVEEEAFVEFGVGDYSESNTRFLLLHNYWRGLVIDGSKEAMDRLASAEQAWRHRLVAKHAWITVDNIDELISGAGFNGDIGILSVDVDGMDYWIWRAIHCVKPRIVICEYNSLFGATADVTLAPKADFMRGEAHYSNLLYGASLAALTRLAAEKGFRLVGVNTAGNNAFFVRNGLADAIPGRTVREVFQPCRYRESRNPDGTPSHLEFGLAQNEIAGAMVWDFKAGAERILADVEGWR